MNKTLKIALGVAPFLLSVACTDPNEGPAERAIKAADQAAAALTPEVREQASEQVRAFSEQLDAARAAAAKQDFKAARATAEALPARAREAVAATKEKLAAMKRAFDDASGQLSDKATALRQRVEELAAARRLPKGITKEALEAAREALAEVEAGATRAREVAAKDAAAAAEAARALAKKADEAVASLTQE